MYTELAPKKRSVPLWRFYHQLNRYDYRPYHPEGIRLLDKEIANLQNDVYTSYPDLWHNTAMIAARLRHHEGELAIVQSGLREWEDDIDLLCDELQLRYSTSYDLDRAEEIWARLWEIHERTQGKTTGPYWRFWVFGAQYHTRVLRDVQTALKLLSEGMRYVRRDSLMDLFRVYRSILVDGPPGEELTNEHEVIEHQKHILDVLEEKYRQGLLLGLENGYVLAQELARLYQERAITEADLDDDHHPQQGDSDQYLEKALSLLKVAERLYTGNRNHPITDIYIAEARIHMAREQYEDALTIFNSLSEQDFLMHPDLAVMAKIAAPKAGGTFFLDEKQQGDHGSDSSVQEKVNETLTKILTDPEQLAQLAHQHPEVRQTLFRAVQILQE